MSFPRTALGFFPTPVTDLTRLSRVLGGPKLFIKRDDQTGLALGGNKTRKLEFLVGEAIDQGCDTVITGGAMQSNHCRQTAAAAAATGLHCHLVLGGEAPDRSEGNLLLDEVLGATLHWAGPMRKGETIPALAEMLRNEGRNPYIIPYGGSNAVGARGFVAAMGELRGQIEAGLPAPTHVVFASSSGGTHAGMIVGARAFGIEAEIIGIGIDKDAPRDEESLAGFIHHLSVDVAADYGFSETIAPGDVILDDSFIGEGYGVVGDLEKEAINLLARSEGILVDPVYTGRAFGGLVALVRNGRFGPNDRVLFWHTGGAPALFAYGDKLV
ncbi:MAG: D-cysteine desulfhydrase family protein [Hyphomicrobiales bacterium]|nr:MAG: D-cysteine desulfhydrase family protein [Hyphomicrobiales bacterium]